MAETITLPRSGLVLRWCEGWRGYELAISDGVDANLGQSSDGSWDAWIDHDDGFRGTEAECIAWLDARVLALRAALLPAGAIVVADTPETREIVAVAVRSELPFDTSTDSSLCQGITDAVLAALREAGR